MFRLHVTDTQLFDDCKRKWYFGSLLHGNLTPRYPEPSLFLGTGIHLALEAYAGALIREYSSEVARDIMLNAFWDWTTLEIIRADKATGGLEPEDELKLKGNRELGLDMLRHYSRWCSLWDAQRDVRYISDEEKFEIPLTKNVLLCGRLDGVVEVNGALWVIDHKTTSHFDTDGLALDIQGRSYLLAANHLHGRHIKGIIYNFLRKKAPVVPELLKKGGLTRRKDIDTTWPVYAQALQANGLNAEEYTDMRDILVEKGNTFFHREFVEHSLADLDRLINQMAAVSNEMRGESYRPTTRLDTCRRCTFLPVCEAMIAEQDWEFILKTKYKEKEEHRVKLDWREQP